jgi:ribonucleoside-diphosphate reductase beta chain
MSKCDKNIDGMIHKSFITTSRGLQRDALPMRLFEKAKRLGVWNPTDIDFGQDTADWRQLSLDEQDILLHLTALFQAGEEAVTLDL